VEHPVRHDFTLVDAKPVETASDVHRFEVKVPAGATKSLTVTEEKTFQQNFQVSTQNDDQIRFFLSQPFTSAKVKAGLQQALDLRWALAKTTREIGEQERQLKTITDDQDRLRKNLKEMPPTAAAYKRYLEKFDQQETAIEKYQADIKKLQTTQHEQRKALDDFLAAFSAD
jgi:septal ring factor EnvC (AmiA/AmiB activator)